MTTRATMNYIAVYQDILENYNGDNLLTTCSFLDTIASKCLTNSEELEYCKATRKLLEEISKGEIKK